jgi:hypothetical protein
LLDDRFSASIQISPQKVQLVSENLQLRHLLDYSVDVGI